MSVINFPGTGGKEEEKKVSPNEIFDSLKEANLEQVFVVGIKDTGEVTVSGNCTIAHGVYLAEVAKNMLIEGDRE